MADVAERIKKVVIDKLGVNADQITLEANFVDDLGADSLATVELLMGFEDEFEIEIPEEVAEKIKTVGDAIKYLETKV